MAAGARTFRGEAHEITHCPPHDERAERMDFVNITDRVQDAVAKSGVQEGCVSSTRCTSRLVFINDDEPGLHEDYSDG